MQANITNDGILLLTAETHLEEFALRKWYELHGNSNILPIFTTDMIRDSAFFSMSLPEIAVNELYLHKELGVVRVFGIRTQRVHDWIARVIDVIQEHCIDTIEPIRYHVFPEQLTPYNAQPTEVPLSPK